MRATSQGILLALLAAMLFGLVNVAARASSLPPLAMTAYAYLLAGLLFAPTLRRMRIERRDWPKLAGMSLAGGALAPVLLFYGLERARAADASLLLTLEMVSTAILAASFLRERVRPAAWLGIALLFGAAIAIARTVADGGAGGTTLMGAALVLLAAVSWGVDNTISARLVGRYAPHQLLAIKGLAGGSAALVAAAMMGVSLALPPEEIRYVAYIGILGVGGSILFFYHALRRVGATLTASLFIPATALVGVLGGWAILHERLTLLHALAAALALAGVVLIARSARSPA